MASVSGCDGRCCSVFNYSATLDELRARDTDEARYLVDMLIPLTPEQAKERALRFGATPPPGYTLDQWAAAGQAYTCRHWDEDTRLCTAYETRPKMCSDYPYARRCEHGCGCYAPQTVIDEYLKYEEARRDG